MSINHWMKEEDIFSSSNVIPTGDDAIDIEVPNVANVLLLQHTSTTGITNPKTTIQEDKQFLLPQEEGKL
jgi:hypothetical protein